ncbi:MAG: aspartate dehydrogenase [Lachnospiraceae bacterium]|nr:aspartate dehydrogenase [Lachnospiraceae bacterium]
MFHRKIKKVEYDRENQKPVIRSSICTGEQVAGFRDVKTGKFTEVMLIRNNKDLDKFLENYDISVAEIVKEW